MKRIHFTTLDQLLAHLKAARGFLRTDGQQGDDGMTIEAAWRGGYTGPLHGACREMLTHGGKDHFTRLPFTAADMGEDERRLEELETGERAAEDFLQDLRTDKEAVKARMARRAAVAMHIVSAQLSDPLASKATTDDLKTLSAKPRALVSGYGENLQVARRKGKAARQEATALRQDRDRLKLENKVLSGQTLSVADVAAPAPAASRTRRAARRG